MTNFFRIYITSWSLACIAAALLMIRHRSGIELFQLKYWRYLLQSWKISLFLIATIGLIVIAPYTGDPTWDYFDAFFMSVLAFCTAPWVVGIIYLTFRRKGTFAKVYVAVCIWMFSASWSYDLYLILRDGIYPLTWFSNIFASSVLYISAGLLWNLEWKEKRGVIFGFMEPNWPEEANRQKFGKIIWIALPLMVLVTAMIASFVL